MMEQDIALMEAMALLQEEARDERRTRHMMAFAGADFWEDHVPRRTRSQGHQAGQSEGLDALLLSMLPVDDWTVGAEAVECPLCLAEYEEKEKVMRLPCLHQAHEECIMKWLSKSRHCPQCKLDLQESLSSLYGD